MAELKDMEFVVSNDLKSTDDIISDQSEIINQLRSTIIEMGTLIKRDNQVNASLSEENKQLKDKIAGLERLCWEYQRMLRTSDVMYDDILTLAKAVGVSR